MGKVKEIVLFNDNFEEAAGLLGVKPEELGELVLICRIRNINFIDNGDIRVDFSGGFPRDRDSETSVDPAQIALDV